MTKSLLRAAGAYTIGRRNFANISAVEGITLSRETEADSGEFDRHRLSLAEGRGALLRKYGREA